MYVCIFWLRGKCSRDGFHLNQDQNQCETSETFQLSAWIVVNCCRTQSLFAHITLWRYVAEMETSFPKCLCCDAASLPPMRERERKLLSLHIIIYSSYYICNTFNISSWLFLYVFIISFISFSHGIAVCILCARVQLHLSCLCVCSLSCLNVLRFCQLSCYFRNYAAFSPFSWCFASLHEMLLHIAHQQCHDEGRKNST